MRQLPGEAAPPAGLLFYIVSDTRDPQRSAKGFPRVQ